MSETCWSHVSQTGAQAPCEDLIPPCAHPVAPHWSACASCTHAEGSRVIWVTGHTGAIGKTQMQMKVLTLFATGGVSETATDIFKNYH